MCDAFTLHKSIIQYVCVVLLFLQAQHIVLCGTFTSKSTTQHEHNIIIIKVINKLLNNLWVMGYIYFNFCIIYQIYPNNF